MNSAIKWLISFLTSGGLNEKHQTAIAGGNETMTVQTETGIETTLETAENTDNLNTTDNLNADDPTSTSAERITRQDEIYTRYGLHKEKTNIFGAQSGAYPFTNEPFGNWLDFPVNVDGPVLAVTASGDPLCLLAGKGARRIFGADISIHANIWGEYKFAGFQRLTRDEFIQRFGKDATWEQFPFELPVSAEAQRRVGQMRQFPQKRVFASSTTTGGIFQDEGYACPGVGKAGYTNKNDYSRLQNAAQGVDVTLYPCHITTFAKDEGTPAGPYTAIYVSNVPDHILKGGARNLKGYFGPLSECLDQEGQFLINIEWVLPDRIRPDLKNLGFELRLVEGPYSGCGNPYVAERKEKRKGKRVR